VHVYVIDRGRDIWKHLCVCFGSHDCVTPHTASFVGVCVCVCVCEVMSSRCKEGSASAVILHSTHFCYTVSIISGRIISFIYHWKTWKTIQTSCFLCFV